MSISDLLVPNNYKLFVNGLNIRESLYAIPSAASTDWTATVGTNTVIGCDSIITTPVSGQYTSPTYTVPSTDTYYIEAGATILSSFGADSSVSVSIQVLSGATPIASDVFTEWEISGKSYAHSLKAVYLGQIAAGTLITVAIKPLALSSAPVTHAYGGQQNASSTYLKIVKF